MATKKTTKKKKESIPMPGTIGGATLVFNDEPKIIKGSHSTRIEYADGKVEFTTDWDALQRDVREAISSYEASLTPTEKQPKAKKSKKKTNRIAS